MVYNVLKTEEKNLCGCLFRIFVFFFEWFLCVYLRGRTCAPARLSLSWNTWLVQLTPIEKSLYDTKFVIYSLFISAKKKWHHTLVAARSKRRPVLLQYLQFLWVFRCVNFEICIDSLFGEEEKTKLANCIPFRLSNSWCSVKFNFACAQPVSTPGENAYSTFLLSVTPRNSQRQRVLRLNMRCLTETQYLFQFRADPMKRKILNIYNDNEHSTHYLYKLSVIVRLPYDRFFRVTAKIKQK